MRTIFLMLILMMLPSISIHADDLFLKYEWAGGHSPYSKATVEISKNGESEVKLAYYDQESFVYKTKFNANEMEFIRSVIESTGIVTSDIAEHTGAYPTDSGKTTLFVAMAKGKKEVTFIHQKEFQPIQQLLYTIVNQAAIYNSFTNQEDLYSVLGALSPSHAARKIFQPYVFREPLIGFVNQTKNKQKMKWGLEALPHVMTPQEYAGLIAKMMKKQDKKFHHAIPVSNLGKEHKKMLMPVLFNKLVQISHLETMDDDDRNMFYGFLSILAENKHVPIIDILLARKRLWDLPNLDGALINISKLGEPAMSTIIQLLKSKDLKTFKKGVELTYLSSELNPKTPSSHHVTEYEYAKMKKAYVSTMIPVIESRLSKLKQNSPDYKSVSQHLMLIKNEMAK